MKGSFKKQPQSKKSVSQKHEKTLLKIFGEVNW